MVEKKTSTPPADEAQEVVVDQEVVVKKAKISMVWIVPLVVVVLGGIIIFKTIRDAGIPITLTFESAEGLEAGKTMIRYKDVDVGLVDAIRISDDLTHVVLDVTVNRHAEKYLVETTRFWVVRPRVTLQGITGLGTLLSGAYINIDPGTEGTPTREFEGLEIPPVLQLDSDARKYVLHAEDLGSISVGSPIIYKGFNVGEVLSYRMMDDESVVEIEFFVRHPYHEQIFTGSKFWDVSGLDVRAGADGIDVKVASLESLMIGGIAFENSTLMERRVLADEKTVFKLHRRQSDIDYFGELKRKVRFYFEDSLRGLTVGAPVEYQGIKIGEVTDISASFDPETLEIKLPVTAVIEPERFAVLGAEIETDEKKAAERLAQLVELGLRGQLKSGNLISGALFVDLVMEPDTPIRLVGGPEAEIPEMPTIPSTTEQIVNRVEDIVIKLDQFMARIDNLEIEKLVSSAVGTVEGIEKLVESEDLTGALKSTRDLLEAVQPVIGDLRRLVVNVDEELVGTSAGIADILEQAETTFINLNKLLESDSPTQTDVRSMLKEISGMARSFRSLADYLERYPEALIKGKPGGN